MNAINLFKQLLSVLGSIPGVSILDLPKLISTITQVFSTLGDLPEADTSEEIHSIAIRILAPVAALTTTDLDDGALIAMTALSKDPLWHAYIDKKIDSLRATPEGVLTLQAPLESDEDLIPFTQNVSAVAVGQGITAFASWLPILLQVLEILRNFKRK